MVMRFSVSFLHLPCLELTYITQKPNKFANFAQSFHWFCEKIVIMVQLSGSDQAWARHKPCCTSLILVQTNDISALSTIWLLGNNRWKRPIQHRYQRKGICNSLKNKSLMPRLQEDIKQTKLVFLILETYKSLAISCQKC